MVAQVKAFLLTQTASWKQRNYLLTSKIHHPIHTSHPTMASTTDHPSTPIHRLCSRTAPSFNPNKVYHVLDPMTIPVYHPSAGPQGNQAMVTSTLTCRDQMLTLPTIAHPWIPPDTLPIAPRQTSTTACPATLAVAAAIAHHPLLDLLSAMEVPNHELDI